MRRLLGIVAGGALAVTAAVVPDVAGQATTTAPSLRMLTVMNHADVIRGRHDRYLYVPQVAYVAADGGAFEVDVHQSSDGHITLELVDRENGQVRVVRQLDPPKPVQIYGGLPDFFQLVLRDSSGAVVGHRNSPFCPGSSWGESRVDASGPANPTYPYFCGSPLTRATAWGIDTGWADPVDGSIRTGDIPDGHYQLTIGIAPEWADQLGIAPADAQTTVDLKVTTGSYGGHCTPDVPCPVMFGASSGGGGTSSSEGPQGALRVERSGNDGRGGPGGLPNLAALPAHDLSIDHDRRTGHDYLDFGATIWNGGSGPLVLEGFRQGASETMTAVQSIYRDGKVASVKTVGEFEFDHRQGHNHWHMEDIARYDLLDKSGNEVVMSDKQSFCLAPTDPVDLLADGADWQPDRIGLGSACGGEEAIWLREVLPAGWGDTYYQSVAGQSFDITDLPNGTYQLQVTTDPNNNLEETSYDDNASRVAFTLRGKPGSRRVAVIG